LVGTVKSTCPGGNLRNQNGRNSGKKWVPSRPGGTNSSRKPIFSKGEARCQPNPRCGTGAISLGQSKRQRERCIIQTYEVERMGSKKTKNVTHGMHLPGEKRHWRSKGKNWSRPKEENSEWREGNVTDQIRKESCTQRQN